MKSAEKIIISFATGVGLGALLGILFAPEKGSDTRRNIKDKAEEYYHKMGDMLEEVKEKAIRKRNEIQENIHELIAEGEDELTDELIEEDEKYDA